MPRTLSGSQRRIIDAALELFASQGFDSTTTKQIADRASANEATLFRNFGSKHGLLLAVLEDSGVFARLPEALGAPAAEIGSLPEAVMDYSRDRLQGLGQLSELLRAFVGEAGQYSWEQRQAFGRELVRGTQEVARYFAAVVEREQLEMQVSLERFVGLLDSLLFGYLMTELTGEFPKLWRDREDFLNTSIEVCLYGAMSPLQTDGLERSRPAASRSTSQAETGQLSQPKDSSIADLPAELVRKILQQAKKQGAQPYALAYLLFGAGLLPEEVLALERSHHVCTPRQNLLHITRGAIRQVPINQWIAGKRYGSYGNNPLSQWLKSRKDGEAALFLSDRGQPMAEPDLQALWQAMAADLLTPQRALTRIEQARQTWCVEMLMKGINPEDLSILSGWTLEQLQPYERRAREKAALERAIDLDRQSNRAN